MLLISKLFTKKQIPVSFLDLDGAILDKTLFNKRNYNDINQNGIQLSAMNIMHYASIHYSGRFTNSVTMRFINSFVDIISSIEDGNDRGLILSNSENSEFQTRSSEVIAVGICVAITAKLFAINKNSIGLIEGSGKRCDFSFIKNNLEYYIESKGRKGSTKQAMQDVLQKKVNYDPHAPKYGVISHLPRNTEHITVDIIDPEFTPKEIDKNVQVGRLLLHYSKVAYVSGFWRLGDLLVERYEKILNGADFLDLNEKPLDFENISKLGTYMSMSFNDLSAEIFIPRNKQNGFRKQFDKHTSLFLMEKRILEILTKQDLQGLLEYKYDEETVIRDDAAFSILSDGSVLAFVATENIEKYS